MKITNIYKTTATLALMAAILAPVQEAWGQAVKGNKYKSSYGSGGNVVTTSDKEIQHKPAKWHGMRSGGNFVDTFDDTQYFTSGDGSTQIQAAHTYVDTLYVKKGSLVSLWLPTIYRSQDQNSTRYYQRWYNYLTEGTFATGLTGDNNVNDILTPKSGIVYRFQNGYVGGSWMNNIMYGANFYYPKDNEYTGYKGLNNGSANNSYYIVACDVSGYTDFDQTTYTEPTLGLRVLYYIVGIDDTWGTNKYENQYERLNKDDYKNGGNKYLEEYEITFPCDHIGNFTNELVSIARQAQFYRVPGDDSGDKLTATLTTGADIFKLVDNGSYDSNSVNGNTLTLGDDSRAIFFRKKEGNNNQAPWSVLDGTTATILVTKTVGETTYNIARFKLTFKKNIRLLTQHQIARLDEARANNTTITGEGGWFDESYLYRTPAYLDENYILLTSRTFDYDSNVTGAGETTTHQGEYYPYPLAWDFSSYAFYDGTKEGQGFDGSTDRNTSFGDAFTEWGSYAIVKDYMGYGDKTGSLKAPTEPGLGGRNSSGYFLYVDASNLPGKLVTLPFEEELCAGSELLVSAWVKSAGENNTSTDDAAMLFSIYGIDGDGNRTLIHAQTTGQIRRTTNITTGEGEYTHANGYGSKQNDWYQVFLSFLNDDVEKLSKFKSYEVQIDNNSGSTSGGDFYLDEIKVYVAKPNAKVEQLAVSCEERTLMNIQLAWTRLMARIGNIVPDPGTEYSQGIDFCFIDSVAYEVYRRKNPDKNWTDAVRASLVNIGNVTDYDSQFATLYYDLDYVKNKLYVDKDDDGAVLASENRVSSDGEPAKYGFYRIGTDTPEEMALSVDIYTALKQNRRYMILMKDHTRDDDVENIAMYGEPEEVCSIVTSFEVDGRNHIIMNGQVVDPTKTDTYCIGQAFTFSVRLTYYDEAVNDYVPYEGTVYFDWFFGNTMQENGLTLFESPNKDYGDVSLEEALLAFRTHYPDVEATEGTDGKMLIDVNLVEDDIQTPFTEDHKAIIEHYLNKEIEAAGLNKQLVLHRSELGIRLLEDGLDLAVAPIPVIGVDIALCFAPSFLTLEPNGLAPVVLPGFENMSYTDYGSNVERTDYYPAMRIGLKQIEASSENKPIRINLRNAKFAYDNMDKPSDYNPNHIGLMPAEKELYLISSNDPALYDLLNPTDGEYDRHQYSIGKVVSFYAKPYGGSGPLPDNHMDIYFDLMNPMSGLENNDAKTAIEEQVFKPREGYEYRFGVHFEEHEDHTGQSEEDYVATPGSCYNYMEITMKVVPEYLVWQGKVDADGKIDNWNEDSVWKRISSDKINKSEDDQSDYFDYFTNGNNQNENGYVPMLFTKVIIPENSQVALHSAGFTGSPDKYRNMVWKTDRPEYIKQPTKVNIPEDASVGMTEGHPIHYDMMVFTDEQGNMSTKPFRVNLCDEIHFEPGAEMMHAELLTYEKAWVDYQLAGDRWYALSSPLKDVVSGDFYTDQSGTEEQEYFTPINWSNDNSRTAPSVYQRGWKGDAATMVGVGSGDTRERAIVGNWSAVYNKADEGYDAGTGFSLKVLDLPEGTNNATFRLPKADTKYTYSGGTTATETKVITRTDAHRLHVTDLNTEATTSITVTLEANGNNPYYLVGNPFMAHLDMAKFFAENSNLESKYWVVNGDNQEVGVGGNNGLITTGNGKIAPLSSFFVTKKDNSTANNEVVFTADMQVLGEVSSTSTNTNALTITATTTDGRTSRAAVAYDMAASADYEASEDAELFLDSNLGDVPMVYTVAGTMATSINRTSELYNIPLGVYGNKQEMVTLSFGGLNQFSSATLYDAQEQTETPLREGKTVSVPAGTSGRYFLRAGTPTGNEVIARNAFLVYSVGGGKVMVTSSNTPLKDIRVYTMGGAQVRSIQASGMQQEIYLNRGIYLITVSDQDGLQETKKVLVR